MALTLASRFGGLVDWGHRVVAIRKRVKRMLAAVARAGGAKLAWLLTRKMRASDWSDLMLKASGDGEQQAREIVGCATAALSPQAPDIFAMFLQGYVLFGRPLDRPDLSGRFWIRPLERAIIDRHSAHVPSRVRSYARNSGLIFRENIDGPAVLKLCQSDRSQGWLTDDVREVYESGIPTGLTYTAGAYRDEVMVAGLFGVKIGSAFCLMSMNHSEDKAGSILMAWLVNRLSAGEWRLIDCSALKPNFVRYGAFTVSADEFSDRLLAGLLERDVPASAAESDADCVVVTG